MGHIGQEPGLGLVGLVGRLVGQAQGLPGLQLRLLAAGHVRRDNEHLGKRPVLPGRGHDGQLLHGLPVQADALHLIHIGVLFDILPDRLQAQQLLQRFQAVHGPVSGADLVHQLTVGAAGGIPVGVGIAAELIVPGFHIHRAETLHLLHQAGDQPLHIHIFLQNAVPLLGALLHIRNVPQEGNGISGGLPAVRVAVEHHMAQPALLTVQFHPELHALLPLEFRQNLADIIPAAAEQHHIPVFRQHIFFAERLGQSIPIGAVFHQLPKGRVNLLRFEAAGFQIHHVLADIAGAVDIVEQPLPLGADLGLFPLVYVHKQTHHAADGAIGAADGLAAELHPLAAPGAQQQAALRHKAVPAGVKEKRSQLLPDAGPVLRVDALPQALGAGQGRSGRVCQKGTEIVVPVDLGDLTGTVVVNVPLADLPDVLHQGQILLRAAGPGRDHPHGPPLGIPGLLLEAGHQHRRPLLGQHIHPEFPPKGRKIPFLKGIAQGGADDVLQL